jgi:hypothetical protein
VRWVCGGVWGSILVLSLSKDEADAGAGLSETVVVEVAPKRPKRARKVAVDEPDLIGAK